MTADLPHIAAEWPRNNRETVRVQLSIYGERPVIDCRVWFPDQRGELKPGRSGLTLSVKHLPPLAEGLAKALTEAKSRGLVD